MDAAPRLCPWVIINQTNHLSPWTNSKFALLFHYFAFPVHEVSSATSSHCHNGDFNPCNCTGVQEKLCSGILICPISPSGYWFSKIDDMFVSKVKSPSIKLHCVVIAGLLPPILCQMGEAPWSIKPTSSQIKTMKGFDRILSASFRKY